ncbi:carbohydrate ABC transporter permease [Murimonas intestini]|uniref:Multiple sugar ABC transporter membrane protein n=2 Tax=Murimonas intestini TaxID=1337051 RepID=A0AB73T602_9FIRM|nr:carbohydrate ABC transporter permease [Murimonas intestini]MCR1864979.1 carbohydrate ABC transporter permease [Murimonas intestini]MCR1885676.1 carbohydrate ABC transporter permease [Murimonas intestini]
MMNMKTKKRITNILTYICLIFWFLCIALVLYVTVVNSFKTQAESSKSFLTLPEAFNIQNYIEVFNRSGFLQAVFNTTFFTLVSIAIVTIFVPAVSYAVNQTMPLKTSKFTLYYITAAMFVPFQIVALPLSMFMKGLGLGNRLSIIIIFVTYPLIQGVYLCNGYLKTIPRELAESAYVEGAGSWKTFFKVIFPIMKPMTATIVITNFLWMWNEFLISLMILGADKKTQTLPLFIYSFKGQYSIEYNLLFAAIVLSSIPLTVMYVFLQKYIVAGLAGGAVKG